MSRKLEIIVTVLFFSLISISTSLFAEERFTDNGDGTVTDHQLGVMWAKTDNQGDITWRHAGQWVKFTFPYTLPKAYDNWRMPTTEELNSLLVKDKAYSGYETDCGQRVRIVDSIRLTCGSVWSSDTSAIQARVFNFQRGIHYMDRMAHKRAYRALPVRDIE